MKEGGAGVTSNNCTLLAPLIMRERERKREAGEKEKERVRTCVHVCAATKMDQQDRVSHRHTVGVHPRCCFDYFGQSPEIS